MQNANVPGISEERAQLLFAASLIAAGIGDVGTYLLADLPDPAPLQRRTIWVPDLWSALPAAQRGGRMVSEGGSWKPIRPLVSASMAVATMSTVPFVSPTTLILTNAGLLGLGVTRTVTLGAGSGFAVPYPGYRQRVVKPKGALGVLNILGGVGAAITTALTGWADFEWDPTDGWVQTAAAGLV